MPIRQPALRSERLAIVRRLERWLELPLFFLSLVWLSLLVLEFTWGLPPALELFGTLIWAVFVGEFLLRFAVAPDRLRFLRKNALTAVALIIPALRVLRFARVARLVRATQATRGLRLVRLITSFNRGMRALAATLGRRGFGYISLLTTLVTVLGAAGIYAFEKDAANGSIDSYGTALWWTAMLMTTMGSEYWPRTGEGRLLCLLFSLYAFGVFGYVTATIATFFIGRDAESSEAELAGSEQIRQLMEQISDLRDELRASVGRSPHHAETPGSTAPSHE
jgi:voltage-gated potassium channel